MTWPKITFAIIPAELMGVRVRTESEKSSESDENSLLYPQFIGSWETGEAMCVNNLPKFATQWNNDTTRDSNRRRRVRIPSALTIHYWATMSVGCSGRRNQPLIGRWAWLRTMGKRRMSSACTSVFYLFRRVPEYRTVKKLGERQIIHQWKQNQMYNAVKK